LALYAPRTFLHLQS